VTLFLQDVPILVNFATPSIHYRVTGVNEAQFQVLKQQVEDMNE
jgi:hypothetical protein